MRRGALLIAACLLLAAAAYTKGGGGVPPSPSPPPVADRTTAPVAGDDYARPGAGSRPANLIYAHDTPAELTLWRRPLHTEATATRIAAVGRYGSIGTVDGSDPTVLQVIEDRRPDVGHGHFDAEPHLRLLHGDGRAMAELGLGTGAELAPDRRTVAFLAPAGLRTCEGDDPDACTRPPADLVLTDLGDLGRRRPLGRFEDAQGLAWVGPDTMLMLREGTGHRLVQRTGAGRAIRLPGPLLSAAPAAGVMAVGTRDLHGLRLTDTDGRTRWERDFAPDRVLVAMSPDGAALLVQTVRPVPGGNGLPQTRLELVDARTGRGRRLAEDLANGEMLWGPGGGWFAYRRETADRRSFEAVLCRLQSETETCETVFSYAGEVQLLALEGA
jgi:hypothetical protein